MNLEHKRPTISLKNRWIFLGAGIGLAIVFLFFGVRGLVFAYSLTDPFEFIMLFFSSCLIILINATILLILLIISCLKLRSQTRKEE